MNNFLKTILEIIRIFYGELFNNKIPINRRINRILARFSISKLITKIIILKNSKNNFYFSNDNNFSEINIVRVTNNLNRDGIFEKFKVNSDDLELILNYCRNKKFNFNRDPNRQVNFSERFDFRDLYIMNIMNPHKECEAIDKIFRNKKLVEIVKNYLGVYPKLDSTQIFWSIPYYDKFGKPKEPPNKEFGFHYDIDGFKFLKFFIYLTDVTDQNCGQHSFIIKKNEKTFKEKIFRRIDDRFAFEQYNSRIKNIFGNKGTAFLEDTSYYHKGNFPLKERGMLAFTYNLSTW